MSNIIVIEHDILRQMNDFNMKYANYVRCGDPAIQKSDKRECSKKAMAKKKTDLEKSYTTLSKTIVKAQKSIKTLKPLNYKFDASFNALLKMDAEVLKERRDLDTKMGELYKNRNSISSIYQSQLDSTVYAGMLWTILATSMVYFIFVKL